MRFIAAIKKPPVPHAQSSTTSLGLTSTMSVIISATWRGVKYCPTCYRRCIGKMSRKVVRESQVPRPARGHQTQITATRPAGRANWTFASSTRRLFCDIGSASFYESVAARFGDVTQDEARITANIALREPKGEHNGREDCRRIVFNAGFAQETIDLVSSPGKDFGRGNAWAQFRWSGRRMSPPYQLGLESNDGLAVVSNGRPRCASPFQITKSEIVFVNTRECYCKRLKACVDAGAP